MKVNLENNKLKLVFDSDMNNVTELTNIQTGENYIKSAPTEAIFSIWALSSESGKRLHFYPGEKMDCSAINKNGLKGLKLNSESLVSDGHKLDAAVEINVFVEEWGCEVEWTIAVTNRDSQYTVVEVMFPHLQGIILGPNSENDTLIYPHHAGEKTLNPCAEYRTERYLNFWRANTRFDRGLYYREINYCGLASMMWMYLYDDKNGLYIASHDNDFKLTGIRAETGGADLQWMGFGLRKYVTIAGGQYWRSNPYVTAVTCEDWHWGARTYRRWFDRYITLRKHPDYLENEYVLNQCYNFKKDGSIYRRFSDIPQMYEAGREFNMRHMFIASWNRKGFDCNYPEYHPDMELGTSMDLYNGCRYVNEHGGFVTFYINARIFDLCSDFFEAVGRPMALKSADGSLVTEKYGDVSFAAMCPGDARWRKLIKDTALWMAQSYCAAGIYLDQLGSAEPFPCYDRTHSHPDIGDFNKGYKELLEDLIISLQRINPKSFLMTENCGDIYSCYVWGSLTWNGDPYDEFYNVFKYTFPEYTQVNMVNPRFGSKGQERIDRFYKDFERAVLLGAVLWLGPTYKFEKSDEELRKYALKAVAFRGRINPYINESRYMDDQDIIVRCSSNKDGTYNYIKTSMWQASDGSRLILAGNIHMFEGYRVEIGMDKAPSDVHIEDLDGRIHTDTWTYDKVNHVLIITVPKSKLAFFYIKSNY